MLLLEQPIIRFEYWVHCKTIAIAFTHGAKKHGKQMAYVTVVIKSESYILRFIQVWRTSREIPRAESLLPDGCRGSRHEDGSQRF